MREYINNVKPQICCGLSVFTQLQTFLAKHRSQENLRDLLGAKVWIYGLLIASWPENRCIGVGCCDLDVAGEVSCALVVLRAASRESHRDGIFKG